MEGGRMERADAIMLSTTWRPWIGQAKAANATGRDSRHAESCYRLSNIGLDRLCRRDVVVALGGVACSRHLRLAHRCQDGKQRIRLAGIGRRRLTRVQAPMAA